MFENEQFQKLVEAGNSTGEVIAVNRFLVTVKGLEGLPVGALVLFENGHRGMVREIKEDHLTILNLDSENIALGTLAVLQNEVLSVGVGPGLVGRAVSALGEPIDGKGPIALEEERHVFNTAPGIAERALLSDRLPTGVAFSDLLFPVVLGQRIALLGDSKSGKSAFLNQLTINQLNSGRIVVYVMIGKRKVEIDRFLSVLEETGAIKHTILVVANIFDSLAQSYLAPYTGCAMAEYFWYGGTDTVIIYDDLSSHAKVYRELSLISRTNPGRDSYPGDMFYAHSSLLERAGKLDSNNKTLSALPVVLTPNDDITAYLATSIMSITDGQLIFDLESFRRGIRPAVNAGLSVTRVGGVAQNTSQKALTQAMFKKLADYHQAEEFSHFGSELATESKADLQLGKNIYEVLKQTPQEIYSVIEQQLAMEVVMKAAGKVKINIGNLKAQARELAKQAEPGQDLTAMVSQLLAANTIKTMAPAAQAAQTAGQPGGGQPPAAAPPAAEPAPAGTGAAK